MNSTKGRVLSTSALLGEQSGSTRKELFILAEDGRVIRVTVWPPFCNEDLQINARIELSRFAVHQYLGQTLVSKSFSGLKVLTDDIDLPLYAKKIFGGIRFESVDELKAKASAGKAAFGFIKAVVDSFDINLVYDACTRCKKSVVGAACAFCPDSGTGLAFRLKFLVLADDGTLAYITLFGESVASLFGWNIAEKLAESDVREETTIRCNELVGKQLVLRVRASFREFSVDGIAKSGVQIAGQSPCFILIQ